MSSLDKDKQSTMSFWRSLEELEQSPELDEFVANEFPENAHELTDPVSRRGFVQIMGASLAFAGFAGAGCRWQEEKAVPLSRRPEDYVPGVPKHFASAFDMGGAAHGVLVTAYDGRPIKVDGNPDHPFTGGGSTTFMQASILSLYDPDRSRTVRRPDGAGTWEDFRTQLKQIIGAAGSKQGAGLAVLTEDSSSPTVLSLRRDLLTRMPRLSWHTWEPVSMDNEREGMRAAFGRSLRPIAKLDKAKTIVALDADILVDHPASLKYARDFAKARRPDDGVMNRLYAIESAFSPTGATADHRLPLRSEQILPFLMALDARISGGQAPSAEFLADERKVKPFVEELAKELSASKGQAVLIAGRRQPPVVHALVAKINATLDAVGNTLDYLPDLDGNRPTHVESIKQLVADMQAGKIDTLLILGGNPVYDAPADLGFAEALGKVATSVHLSHYYDETSEKCSWHIPRAHYLESWGDALAWDGTYTICQPVIEPIFGGKSPIELLALMLDSDFFSAERILQQTFVGAIGGGEKAWRKVLHDGFIPSSWSPESVGAPNVPEAELSNTQRAGAKLGNGELEVVFMPSSHTFDGRFANNAWMQETPDFLTKVTWDNAALVSPRTADDLGIANNTMVKLRLGDRELELPAYVMPGQAPYSIAVALGHGRSRAGQVGGLESDGVESRGFDTYRLFTTGATDFATGATIQGTGVAYELANVQDHWKLDSIGRKGLDKRLPQLIRTGTLATYKEDPDFAREMLHVMGDNSHGGRDGRGLQLWSEHSYEDGYKWGMATDMTKCIGCNACSVACQAENNVPVVGPEQVKKNREMHWIRIDRYFQGDPEDPAITHQPMLCQQCENAPCEQVCPVGATIHSHEGLNDMAYNRCIGTRYCLNNCPYKVRRFNFLQYHENPDLPGAPLSSPKNKLRQLVFNPEVTVRSRGVMEKCTWCVQRIQNGKITARNERRRLRDGEVVTACQQACPTEAIVFGDLNDPESQVSKLHDTKRSYEQLAEFQTLPRNRFLARITNPNPELAARLKR